jgi:hypothetical protein
MTRRLLLLGLSLFGGSCSGEDGRDAASDASTSATPTSVATGVGPTDPTGGATSSTGSASETTADEPTSGGASSESDEPAEPPTLVRLGETFVIPTIAETAPKRFVDAAHDPAGDVYLVVNGNAATGGSFLDADGQPLASPFMIAETAAWTQGSRVVFGGDAFLVAWLDTRDAQDVYKVRGRLVGWDGAGPAFAGPDFVIGGDGAYQEMAPAIAWSATSQTFMVVWHTGTEHDLHAQRVAADGALVGPPIVLTADPDWQSDAGIAWHPIRDEWLVAYKHESATSEVRVRRLAADGAPLGEAITLTVAPGTWLAQVTYLPETEDYLVAWVEATIMARRVDADGAPIAPAFAVAPPGYGNYDGFMMARHPVSGHFAAVFHGPGDEDYALAFDVGGATSPLVMATSSPGEEGNFNPHVVAHSTRREWLMVATRMYTEVVGQRLDNPSR